MKSFTLTAFFLVLIALFATPIVGDYVERRGYDQPFGALQARAPTPGRKKGGSGGDDDDSATATDSGAAASSTSSANFAPANMVNIAGVGVMAMVAGAAAMY